jgi:hypothetical protein
MMSGPNPPSFIPKGDRHWQQYRGTPRRKWLKMIGPLLVSVPFLLLFCYYSAPCHFEAVGREIPE